MWNLPGPGIEPMSSSLVDRFLSTVPPGKFNSTGFEENILICIHLYSIIQGIFTTLKIFCIPPIHLSPKHLATTGVFHFSIFLPFLECNIVGSIQYTALSDWFLVFSNIHLRLLHVFFHDLVVHFFFSGKSENDRVIFHCLYVPQFIYPLT